MMYPREEISAGKGIAHRLIEGIFFSGHGIDNQKFEVTSNVGTEAVYP